MYPHNQSIIYHLPICPSSLWTISVKGGRSPGLHPQADPGRSEAQGTNSQEEGMLWFHTRQNSVPQRNTCFCPGESPSSILKTQLFREPDWHWVGPCTLLSVSSVWVSKPCTGLQQHVNWCLTRHLSQVNPEWHVSHCQCDLQGIFSWGINSLSKVMVHSVEINTWILQNTKTGYSVLPCSPPFR